ncbi:MAG: hydroxyacid dehydrogenase [Thermoflexales bacterium]|nr:hydroxyacid dehydrogenase [Thermoflexales bacterium]
MRSLITELNWPRGIALLQAAGDALYDPALFKDRPRLLAEVADCDALIVRNQTRVDAELIGAAQRLKVVGRLGVGLDNLDLPALRARGITVVTGGTANAISVAEYAMGAFLALARRFVTSDASVKAGGWDRAGGTGFELYGKTLGVLGLGDIGARVARRGAAFGMRVIAYDPLITASHFNAAEHGVTLFETPEAVLAAADFVTLHVPLLPSTANLIDARRLAMMKPTAYLVNTSRGGIVDEAALADALRAGKLAGAALDVRVNEPPGKADPLAGAPNLLLTPHVAGLTDEAQDRISVAVAEDALRVLRGERPLFAVK